MVEEFKDISNQVASEENSAAATTASEATEESKQEKPKGELLCFGGVQKSGGLQSHFNRFR